MNNKHKILIVEDEQVIINFLTTILTGNNYSVIYAMSGNEAISLTASYAPDLILLDLGLLDIDGLEVLERIRSWSDVPVIIVSARQDESEKVIALDMGANDYITKPFGNSELLARIRTAIRQHAKVKHGQAFSGNSRFFVGQMVIDYARQIVKVNETIIHLTPIEYKILVTMSRNSGKVLTHDYIIRQVWGPFASDSQILRVNMANIRRKIELNPADPKYILTEVGVGYRMVDSDYWG